MPEKTSSTKTSYWSTNIHSYTPAYQTPYSSDCAVLPQGNYTGADFHQYTKKRNVRK